MLSCRLGSFLRLELTCLPVVVSKWTLLGLQLIKSCPAFPQDRGNLHSVNAHVLVLWESEFLLESLCRRCKWIHHSLWVLRPAAFLEGVSFMHGPRLVSAVEGSSFSQPHG